LILGYDRLQQLFINLVDVQSNISGGSVTITAAQAGWPSKRMRGSKSPSDSGAGIAEKNLPRLWLTYMWTGPFRRLGGAGLGLAVVKHIVRSGGERRSKVPSTGTTVRVLLPGVITESNPVGILTNVQTLRQNPSDKPALFIDQNFVLSVEATPVC
jgi:signal transduction histidine kinase